MHEKWFAVRTKSNRETAVSEALAGKGYDVLYPRYRTGRAEGRNCPELSRKPLFPGYLFCRFDEALRLPILTVPGVLNVVSTGRNPAPIDESEIESIRVLLQSNLPLSPHAFLQVGDKVIIRDGPLSGASGYVLETNTKKLVVSITLLQRSVSAEVSGYRLERLSRQPDKEALAEAAYAVGNRY